MPILIPDKPVGIILWHWGGMLVECVFRTWMWLQEQHEELELAQPGSAQPGQSLMPCCSQWVRQQCPASEGPHMGYAVTGCHLLSCPHQALITALLVQWEVLLFGSFKFRGIQMWIDLIERFKNTQLFSDRYPLYTVINPVTPLHKVHKYLLFSHHRGKPVASRLVLLLLTPYIRPKKQKRRM